MTVSYEAILVCLVRKDARIAELEGQAAERDARLAALAVELEATRAALAAAQAAAPKEPG